MPKFALRKLDGIQGKQLFVKLTIDGHCQFDDYEDEILGTKRYENELGSIYAYMERVSQLKTVTKAHFKDITPDKEAIKEYEFKTKHLRVYAIKMKNGKIIIYGGYKNRQKKDINTFRSIKKQLIEEKVFSL